MNNIGFLKRYRQKHIGNNGFTMLEFIIIVAIVAVSASITTISMSSLYSFNVKQCAYDIDAMLSKCKVGVMSKEGNVYLRLYEGTDGIYGEYYEAGIAVSNEKLAKDTVSISYISSNGDTINAIDADGVYISFDRTTGSLLTLGEAASLGGGTVGDEGYYSTGIIVKSGEKEVTVRIVPTTGKHFIES